jgi:hypothetical protein
MFSFFKPSKTAAATVKTHPAPDILEALYVPSRAELLAVNPLMLGCSGGAGHNWVLQALSSRLTHLAGHNFVTYIPRDFAGQQHTFTKTSINIAARLSTYIKFFSDVLDLPNIPSEDLLSSAISELITQQPRIYIDMLLDVYDCGYESAAIWNTLQRTGQISELRKLVALQASNDNKNYTKVFHYFQNILRNAYESGMPYTEIISTQVMGLAALCDAIIDYNIILLTLDIRATPIVLHQYMTDLPTLGAVHFFHALAALTPKQQQQIKLYGVELNAETLGHFFEQHHFNGVYSIPVANNPMVREGFLDPANDNSRKFNISIEIKFKKTTMVSECSNADDEDAFIELHKELELESVIIPAYQKIAVIMLGSQASNDSLRYVKPLLAKDVAKIIIFAGNNTSISDIIPTEHLPFVLILGNQDAAVIAQFMTRADDIFIGCGGSTTMEQLMLPHNPHQKIYIHHADDPSVPDGMSSGIAWEDHNARKLISILSKRSLSVQKISPSLADVVLSESYYQEEELGYTAF